MSTRIQASVALTTAQTPTLYLTAKATLVQASIYARYQMCHWTAMVTVAARTPLTLMAAALATTGAAITTPMTVMEPKQMVKHVKNTTLAPMVVMEDWFATLTQAARVMGHNHTAQETIQKHDASPSISVMITIILSGIGMKQKNVMVSTHVCLKMMVISH